MTDDLERWTCGYCGKRWPVTSLADWCFAKHDQETAPRVGEESPQTD